MADAPRKTRSSTSPLLSPVFDQVGQQLGVDPNILRGIWDHETAGGETLYLPDDGGSPAYGPGLHEAAARDTGYKGSMDRLTADPKLAIDVMGKYYKQMLDREKGNRFNAAVRYNVGPTQPLSLGLDYGAQVFDKINAAAGGRGTFYQVPESYRAAAPPLAPAASPTDPYKEVMEFIESRMAGLATGAGNEEQAASGDYTAAFKALEDAYSQEQHTEQLPIPQRSTAPGELIGRLGANIASVLTGNPMFAQAATETYIKQADDIAAVERANVGLKREDRKESRQERLGLLGAKLNRAADILAEKGKHSLSIKLQKEALQIEGQMRKAELDTQKQSALELQEKENEGALETALARIGIKAARDSNGDVSFESTGSPTSAAGWGYKDENERQEAIARARTAINGMKDKTKAQLAMQDLTAMRFAPLAGDLSSPETAAAWLRSIYNNSANPAERDAILYYWASKTMGIPAVHSAVESELGPIARQWGLLEGGSALSTTPSGKGVTTAGQMKEGEPPKNGEGSRGAGAGGSWEDRATMPRGEKITGDALVALLKNDVAHAMLKRAAQSWITGGKWMQEVSGFLDRIDPVELVRYLQEEVPIKKGK